MDAILDFYDEGKKRGKNACVATSDRFINKNQTDFPPPQFFAISWRKRSFKRLMKMLDLRCRTFFWNKIKLLNKQWNGMFVALLVFFFLFCQEMEKNIRLNKTITHNDTEFFFSVRVSNLINLLLVMDHGPWLWNVTSQFLISILKTTIYRFLGSGQCGSGRRARCVALWDSAHLRSVDSLSEWDREGGKKFRPIQSKTN